MNKLLTKLIVPTANELGNTQGTGTSTLEVPVSKTITVTAGNSYTRENHLSIGTDQVTTLKKLSRDIPSLKYRKITTAQYQFI